MSETIATQVQALQKMTVPELRIEWEKVFGEPTKQRHRVYLFRRLARQIQQTLIPKLSLEEETRIAEYRDLIRQLPPDRWFPGKQRGKSKEKRATKNRRIPPPGSVINRTYKNQEIMVKVLCDGFEYDGLTYRSLSAVAREATGYKSVNGLAFFKLSGCR